jgi:hypothetical protein
MESRAPVVLAVALLSVLAGCFGAGKGGHDEKPLATTGNATLLPNETAAPDGRGTISAFNETNKTEKTGIGAMMHTHDYWHGKSRIDNVAWIEAGQIPLPLMPCSKPDNSCTVGGSTPNQDTYPVGTAIVDYDLQPPPAMGMIYEGTKTVEVKLADYYLQDANGNHVPGNPAGHVFFDYLAANDEPGHFHKGGELDLNVPVKIDIKPTDADMPHQTKSLWIFRVYSDSTMGQFFGNITISIVKGYDVVNWPPHPDLYADKTTRTVLDGPVKLASKGSSDEMLFGSDAGWTSPQRVISWGTDTVTIDVKNFQFQSDLPAPTTGTPAQPKGFVLQYRNASSPFLMANFPNWVTLKDAGSDGKSFHFTIDLTKDRGDAYDTPYAQYSRWGFRLVPIWEDATGCDSSDAGAYVGGCQFYPWSESYTMTIIATGHSTAEGVPAGAM